MSTTAPFDSSERPGDILSLPFAAGANLYAGNLIAIDGSGNAVLASDTAGLRVAGRNEEDIVAGVNVVRGEGNARIKRGVFQYKNSTADALTAADVGKVCYVEDAETVNKTGGSHTIKAGIFLGFGPAGVFVDTRSAITG